MGIFSGVSKLFKKGSKGVGTLFKKGSRGLSTVFKKAGKDIVSGVSGLAGGMGGSELGGSIAGLLGPEAIPVGMAIGSIVGKNLGSQSGKVAYSGLEKKKKSKPSIPDGKFFQERPRLGEGGGGQRNVFEPRVDNRNLLEKNRVNREKMGLQFK